MKRPWFSVLIGDRRDRAAGSRRAVSRAARWLLATAALAYISLLIFPQTLFAYEVSHDTFKVYSRERLDGSIHAILDSVEARLSASGIHDRTLEPHIFLSDSPRLYACLSLYVGSRSFAKSYPVLPTSNVFVNEFDAARDLVFRDATAYRQRSLSDVIAHEVTHLLVRKKYGYLRNLMLPAWKQEGYAEYVAGGTLLDQEEGMRRWKADPTDDSGYRYFKDYMLVKYLLEVRKLSVEDLFTRDIDVRLLQKEVLSALEP